MCNHYRKRPDVVQWSLAAVPGITLDYIPADDFAEHTFPKYLAPIVTQERGHRSLVVMRWGIERFIGQGKTKPVTNARNDKLLSRTWKTCTETRRCLIPATGYYEPGLGPAGAKGGILFTVRQCPMFFLAGLWDTNPDGHAFTMVTTEPNDFVRGFHDRMPVILAEAEVEEWLGDETLAEDRLRLLCRGLPSDALHHEALPPKLKIIRPAKLSEPDAQPDLFE